MRFKLQSKDWKFGTTFVFFIICNQLIRKAERKFREIPKSAFHLDDC